MKTKIFTLIVLGLLLMLPTASTTLAADKSAKSKPRIEVTVIEDKTSAADPQSWKAEIVAGPVNSYGELEKIKIASYQKKQERVIAAYRLRESARVAIYRKYMQEEYAALKALKKEDIVAAIYWLEGEKYGYFFAGDAKDPQPSSAAYLAFKRTISAAEKQKEPEEKKVEDAYAAAEKRANEIYDAETSKADDLYAAATRAKP